MANEQITIDDLAGMIKKGFDENTEQHQKILNVLDKHVVMLIDHTERLTRIEKKLEGVVYRGEFEELKVEVEKIKEILAEKKT